MPAMSRDEFLRQAHVFDAEASARDLGEVAELLTSATAARIEALLARQAAQA